MKVWDADKGSEPLSLKGHTARSSPWRSVPMANASSPASHGRDGEGLGCRTRAANPCPSRGTQTRSTPWRSAPMANASSAAARQHAEGLGCRRRAAEPLSLKGHTGRVMFRGVQPRWQTHRLRQLGQDGEGLGCGDGHESSPSRGTQAGSRPWRSAPMANASSRTAMTGR